MELTKQQQKQHVAQQIANLVNPPVVTLPNPSYRFLTTEGEMKW
jgi:hypothetical protein